MFRGPSGCEPDVDYPLINPDDDKDIRPEVSAFKADLLSNPTPIEDRFTKFSTWDSLVSALSILRHVSASYKGSIDCTSWHLCNKTKCESALKDTEDFILRCVQAQAFRGELEAIKGKCDLPKDSRIQHLSPYIDNVGLLSDWQEIPVQKPYNWSHINQVKVDWCSLMMLGGKNEEVVETTLVSRGYKAHIYHYCCVQIHGREITLHSEN
ncbi:uncharacterized protein LOC125663143 [Ostrea edulis]|uniref:uncharacterized protein LOC125663143 n=1 Tax=Ostrea edulis TaxID=37623 RepID=UPI0024AEBAD3|nr:uncharacterized protein LOC125663143 [Ostrea edulis]